MFHVLLILLYAAANIIVVLTTKCEESKYLCPVTCPDLPEGVQLKSESICLRDTDADVCVCWLNNPSSQLKSVFQCETKVNGSVSEVFCNSQDHCFSPNPLRPVCMIILQCNCLPLESRFPNERLFPPNWKRVKAIVHSSQIFNSQNSDGSSVEKVEDVREFRLKHLLFLLGFVIAPLLCWCLLNFFHEGKCRKKASDRPEAQPIPTSQCTTIDNMNNNDDSCGERTCENVIVVPSSPRLPTSSVRSQSFPSLFPSAPENVECLENSTAQQQTLLKYESPPPYSETMERNYVADLGPPPAYDEAVRGTDINIQQLWQTVFILEPTAPEGERT